MPHGPQVTYDYTTLPPRSTSARSAVLVGPDGALEGRLKDGTRFTLGVPAALGDTGLAADGMQVLVVTGEADWQDYAASGLPGE